MGAGEEVVEVRLGSPEFDQVLSLWRGHREWLGFLPDAGFKDRAEKATLLGVEYGGELRAYVLYDLPGEAIKVVHLCVGNKWRGFGFARQLVQELSRRHPYHRGVELSCRRDWPANAIWPKLGFAPVGERPGRSQSGSILTIWRLDHGHADLFSAATDNRESAALDHNIFIDLATGRPEGAESQHLNDDWISEHVELCITQQIRHEIHNAPTAAMRLGMHALASTFRSLPSNGDRTASLLPDVARLIPEAQPADHQHVARAVVGGATYFVTRDEAVLEGAPGLLAEVGLNVLRPEMLVAHLDRARSAGRYEPEALLGTTIAATSLADYGQAVLARLFLNHGAGERKSGLLANLRTAIAAPDDYEAAVFRDSGRVLAALIEQPRDRELHVPLIRVGSSDRLSEAVARQLAYLPRLHAAEAGQERIVVTDPTPSPSVERAFVDEGYSRDGNAFVCEVGRGLRRASDFPDLEALQGPDRTAAAVLVERDRWPMKVIGAGIPTFIVPIKLAFAEQLFDSRLAAGTLFGRETHLGLSREHVYYRKPRNDRGIGAPARILWYVTGKGPGQSESHVRASSRLAEVVVAPWRTLYKRFSRLGVYDERQVADAADSNDHAMALRFSDTELFDRPLPLSELRELHEQESDRFRPLPSPQLVSEHMFCLIYSQSSRHAAS